MIKQFRKIAHTAMAVLVIGLLSAWPGDDVFLILHAQDIGDEKLDVLVQEGIANNPQVQSYYAEWKAAEFKAKQKTRYPEPSLYFSYFGESIETRVGPQEHKYGISQTITFPGKLSLTYDSLHKDVDIKKLQFEAVKQLLIESIKEVYYDLFWVDRALQITENEKLLLNNMEWVARKKYESNKTTQQDVIKVQVELSKLEDRLYRLRQNRKSLISLLNTLLNRSSSDTVPRIQKIKPVVFTRTLEELKETGLRNRQDLLEARYAIEKAESDHALSKFNYAPDITFGYDYIAIGEGTTVSPDDGNDAWMGTVRIDLPIWFRKFSAEINEKQQIIKARQEHYVSVRNTMRYEIEDAYYKVTAADEIVTLYTNALIPQAEQAFETSRTAYETGKLGFMDWLDAERVLFNTRIAYYRAVADYHKEIARLERVVGKDLIED
ncbi:MAG: hypothetical protein GF384_00905 [Elusimicrobia bacterium]|nr:hypothetical protein [Elusimicrobiota bacterium]MBD3411612.1 hypothetical protein [Elusimicrobiota bacterium]